MIKKKCIKCKKVKNINNFGSNIRSKDKKNSWCKECVKKYSKEYRVKHRKKIKEYNKRRYKKNPEKMKEIMKKSYIKNREKRIEYRKEYMKKIKLKTLQKISKQKRPQCANCGCGDIRFLEINHINGGGRKEYKKIKTSFYNYILNGNRKINDLNVLCKVCNTLHYIQKKFGDIPMKVIWRGKR